MRIDFNCEKDLSQYTDSMLFDNDKLFTEYEEHLKQREFYSKWN